MYLWRAVDDEGVVLDLVMQARRDTGAGLKLLRRLLRSNPVPPEAIVTDGLASYGAALKELNLPSSMRSTMRALSMSKTLSDTTSEERRPAP
jgi:putative transposase